MKKGGHWSVPAKEPWWLEEKDKEKRSNTKKTGWRKAVVEKETDSRRILERQEIFEKGLWHTWNQRLVFHRNTVHQTDMEVEWVVVEEQAWARVCRVIERRCWS